MTGSTIRIVQKLMAPLSRRVRLMVGRGVLRLVEDATKCQTVQVGLLADEVRDGVERFQDYGFTSHPHPGAEVLHLAVGGSREHGVVIACEDRRYRVQGLAEGEVALYTDEGVMVLLKRGGEVHLGGDAKQFVALANLVMERLNALQQAHDSHTHQTTATVGPSGVPGVITPTAAPVGPLEDVAASKVKAA